MLKGRYAGAVFATAPSGREVALAKALREAIETIERDLSPAYVNDQWRALVKPLKNRGEIE